MGAVEWHGGTTLEEKGEVKFKRDERTFQKKSRSSNGLIFFRTKTNEATLKCMHEPLGS